MVDADEGKILKRAARGDETAFLLLYERHCDALFRFTCGLVSQAEAAEEITHDCFLSLIRQPLRFDSSKASLRTYLFAAARNLAFKHFRRTAKEVLVDEVPEERRSLAVDEPLRQLLSEEVSNKVREAIAKLPPLQREALLLFEYEGLSLAEITQVVGMDVGAVNARLHRARAGLRRLLAPYFKSTYEITSVGGELL